MVQDGMSSQSTKRAKIKERTINTKEPTHPRSQSIDTARVGELTHAFANSRAQLAMDWELGWVAFYVLLKLFFLRTSWFDLSSALQPTPKFGSLCQHENCGPVGAK